MSLLTPEGQKLVSETATRHGFSEEAVTHMMLAVHQGGGTQAQFNHWEFGGMGQWSMGGMSMIGDMFNSALKGRVEALCNDLSGSLGRAQVFRPASNPGPTSHQSQSQSGGLVPGVTPDIGPGPGQAIMGGGMQMQGNSMGGGFGGGSSLFVSGGGFGNWWPESLGQPGSTGAQNDLKYAYFPQEARLAILLNGKTTVYDTGPHQINGFGQQQSGDQSLSFISQNGLVRVADLPVVEVVAAAESPADPPDDTPDDTPREIPTETPQETPVEAPDEAPASPPVELPDETPTEVPADTPNEMRAPPSAPGPAPAAPSGMDSNAIFAALEKLGALRDMGVLTEAEFNAKKTELLARL